MRQCHNHPFTDWKQTEYWGMADFFMKVRMTGPRNPKKQAGSPGIAENPRVKLRKGQLPDSVKSAGQVSGRPGSEPRRQGESSAAAGEVDDSAANPFFSKAMVNRAWFQLFGRGLVNPVDDMDNDANPASHPQLLVDLADQFASSGFDLKKLYRALQQ